MSYLHDKGVYHRDLKPANCLANRDCTVKVCDFNLARVVDDSNSLGLGRALTQVVCTRWYRSPEVILAQNYTTSIYMWSVGCILVELFRVLNTGGRRPTPKPLFRAGSSWPLAGDKKHGDMLDQIFDAFGTPFEDPRFSRLPWNLRDGLKGYRVRPGSKLRAVMPSEASEPGLDLVEKILCFFPDERLSAGAAVKHEFFKGLRSKSKDETEIETQQLDLGFDDCLISTTQEIRDEMRRTVDRFLSGMPEDEELCVCCGGSGTVAGLGVCPLCEGEKVFAS